MKDWIQVPRIPHAALATLLLGLPMALAWSGILIRVGGQAWFMPGLLALLPLWMGLAWLCHWISTPARIWAVMALLAGATWGLALWARGYGAGGWS